MLCYHVTEQRTPVMNGKDKLPSVHQTCNNATPSLNVLSTTYAPLWTTECNECKTLLYGQKVNPLQEVIWVNSIRINDSV